MSSVAFAAKKADGTWGFKDVPRLKNDKAILIYSMKAGTSVNTQVTLYSKGQIAPNSKSYRSIVSRWGDDPAFTALNCPLRSLTKCSCFTMVRGDWSKRWM